MRSVFNKRGLRFCALMAALLVLFLATQVALGDGDYYNVIWYDYNGTTLYERDGINRMPTYPGNISELTYTNEAGRKMVFYDWD